MVPPRCGGAVCRWKRFRDIENLCPAREWQLCRKYDGKGCVKVETVVWDNAAFQSVHIIMCWTQKGRKLIDQLLRNAGWKPGDRKPPVKIGGAEKARK